MTRRLVPVAWSAIALVALAACTADPSPTPAPAPTTAASTIPTEPAPTEPAPVASTPPPTASEPDPTTVLAPGDPCDPADGSPDCTDATVDATYRYIVGYADCVDALGAAEAHRGCTDLDGDGEAGYPDA
ncbi:hypothetical protein ACPPVS_14950 [Cellulomonas sp. McL0617]|uniref:hypothetical protein n=1 Tax=Cellulomonas sp. McL0617 TaxID=3415675 RepID=UPI003CF3C016